MDRFGLIGWPIGHSLSPALFSAAYGGKYPYDLIETPDFEQSWARFLAGYKAINVTAPFKENAFGRVDWKSPGCERIGATNLVVRTPEGLKAYNSDYLAVRSLLEPLGCRSAAVIGFGGAGKAALAAAEDLGLDTRLYRHAEVAGGVSADVVVYTLPRAVEGIDRIDCAHLLEANYKDPSLSGRPGYIPGSAWLLQQAVLGYELMTGEKPGATAMETVFR
jgi:shikimate 5-dehydrogenase